MAASLAMTAITTLGSFFIANQAMAANCAGVTDLYVNDSSGTACDVSGNNYNHIQGHGASTVINVAAPDVVLIENSSSFSATDVDGGATMNFAGNLDSKILSGRFYSAVEIGSLFEAPGVLSTLNVAGNLNATHNGLFGFAIDMAHNGRLTVGGNLTATMVDEVRYVIYALGNIDVKGSTTVTSGFANGMVLGGDNYFSGPVIVNITGIGKDFEGNFGKTGINFQSSTNSQFKNDVTVNTAGTNSTGIINAGIVNVSGNLNVTTTGTEASVGINVTDGKLTANNSKVSTIGTQAHGVVTSGAGTSEFTKLTVDTAGQQAIGVSVTGAGAAVTLGSGSSVTTTGDGATGVSVTDGSLNFNSGYVSTSGANAAGIRVINPLLASFTTGANVTTTGAGSDGVSLNNVATANIMGNITTSGTGSSGVTYAGVTSGNLTTGGNIDSAYIGIDAAVTDQLLLNTEAGKTITSLDDAIKAVAGGAINVKNASSLNSLTGNGINVVNAAASSTIVNSGNITATTAGKFVIEGGNAVDTVTTTAGTLTGNTDLGAGNDSFTASGGALIGNTLMGEGDDVTTLTGTVDVTAAPQFDGGVGADVLNVDGLALRGFTAASNDGTGNLTETSNNNLTGWETINVKNAGTLKLSNNLFTAANTGTLNVDATSTLDLKGNSPGVFTVYGNVNNSGMMTMADGAADDVTTITGNYSGVAGSQFAIDTVVGNDSSLTDKLVVNGSTSGTTALRVTNVGGAGAQTIEGIQVVQVDGASDATFSLAAPVQAGSYEYTLQKNGVSTPVDGDWYLRSTFVATCANTPALCPVNPIDPDNKVVPPKPPVDIYRPGVALYVTAQSANADAGFLQMSTLHQRMGEQRELTTDKPQTWGRSIGGGLSNNGHNRFEYDQFTTGLQLGRDLLHETSSAGTQQRAGVTVQYAHSTMDAMDRVRPLVGLSQDTGSMNSNSLGLGGYYTRMNQVGAYLDVVSQVNHLTNKFSDSYGGRSKQKGWQFGLSAEVGKPVAELDGWKFEPQAQLSYLNTRYDGFTDRYSNADGLNADQLRGRLGLRVYKNYMVENKAAQYYGIVNVQHDFLKAKAITLHDRVGMGSASVRESYDRTFGELGLGIQGHIRNNTYVYADARYQRSFKGNKEGAEFNVGIKADF